MLEQHRIETEEKTKTVYAKLDEVNEDIKLLQDAVVENSKSSKCTGVYGHKASI